MPIKQRRNHRRAFNDYHREQLLCGPDACLLAGVGYLTAANFADMTEDEQQAALDEMRDDWERHGAGLMAWWYDPDAATVFNWPWVFPVRTDAQPWAATQFGEPKCQ